MPEPVASTGGDSKPIGPMGKAIGVGFLALILINGQMSSNMQFAVIIAIIAYFVFNKKPAGGDAH